MSIADRSFGWIQNPSDFLKLKRTVQIMDSESEHYSKLENELIDELLGHFPDLRDNFKRKFADNIAEFTYSELVGTSVDNIGNSARTRGEAVPNALIQISHLPQSYNTTGKRYVDDWTSDGFLRWAVSLNFIEADRNNDTYKITDLGRIFSRAEDNSEEEKEILRKAFLSYPPATRVIQILKESPVPLNKFEIGNNLGFIGEDGFTSYNADLMLQLLLDTKQKEDQTEIRSNIEGTSDKYARMITGWLRKVGYIETHNEKIDNTTVFQKYSLTALGLHHYNRSLGMSSHSKQTKYLMWEFLSIQKRNRRYVRTRRALIIKYLQKRTSFSSLISELRKNGFTDDEAIIKNDIQGLINFGLRIEINSDGRLVKLLDDIVDFSIPQLAITQEQRDIELEEKKAFFFKNTRLESKFVDLLRIAFDGKANRDFEIITTELINKYYRMEAKHLGGGRKPDGIAYTDELGILYDTKSYRNGYNPSISEKDKMLRYVEDNQLRSEERNPTLWWKLFPERISEEKIYFLWVSGKFTDQIEEHLNYVSQNSSNQTRGAALNVEQLLIGAELSARGDLTAEEISEGFKNKEILFSNKEDLVEFS